MMMFSSSLWKRIADFLHWERVASQEVVDGLGGFGAGREWHGEWVAWLDETAQAMGIPLETLKAEDNGWLDDLLADMEREQKQKAKEGFREAIHTARERGFDMEGLPESVEEIDAAAEEMMRLGLPLPSATGPISRRYRPALNAPQPSIRPPATEGE